jgi:hypothetical protein
LHLQAVPPPAASCKTSSDFAIINWQIVIILQLYHSGKQRLCLTLPLFIKLPTQEAPEEEIGIGTSTQLK